MLEFFRTEHKCMNFELEAETISSEIFIKKSFIVKKRKAEEPQASEKSLQKLSKKLNVKQSWKKKEERNIKHKN